MEGIGDHIEKHPAEVLRNDLAFTDLCIEIKVEVGVEFSVGRTQAVIGKTCVLLDEQKWRTRCDERAGLTETSLKGPAEALRTYN